MHKVEFYSFEYILLPCTIFHYYYCLQQTNSRKINWNKSYLIWCSYIFYSLVSTVKFIAFITENMNSLELKKKHHQIDTKLHTNTKFFFITNFKFDIRLFRVGCVSVYVFPLTYWEARKWHTLDNVFATVSANVIYPTESVESAGKSLYSGNDVTYIHLVYAVGVEERRYNTKKIFNKKPGRTGKERIHTTHTFITSSCVARIHGQCTSRVSNKKRQKREKKTNKYTVLYILETKKAVSREADWNISCVLCIAKFVALYSHSHSFVCLVVCSVRLICRPIHVMELTTFGMKLKNFSLEICLFGLCQRCT